MAAQQFNFFLSQVPFMEAATLAAAEEYRLAQGRLGGLFSVDSLLLNLSKSENRSASLTALHGHGICQFYFHQYARIPGSLDSALLAYHDILRRTDSLYFDTLSTMPVNLQTLLAAENAIELAASIVLRGQMLDAATNGYLPEGIYQRAVVSAEGLPYGYLLNNGQFRVDLPGSWKAPVRLFVRAPGYRPAEMTVLPQDFDKAIVVRLVADTVTAAVQDPPPSTQNTAQILADINRSMVRIQGGTFTMGCLDEKRDGSCADTEKPYRDVTLGDYYIGATEVTIEQYLIFCDETKTHYPEWLEPGNEYNIETGTNDYYKRRGMSRENKKHPITGVSWNDAVAYCEWLSKKTGQPYRLPTEAEWEYAARGGIAWKDGLQYAGSNNIDEVAWYEGNSGSQTHPVAGKKPNQRGLYDMSGNVWEWCQDVWHDNYQGAPLDGRAWMDGGSSGTAVLRGGLWGNVGSNCRPASRIWDLRDGRDRDFGFRLARAASAGGR
ncbi:MAG: formylglycine-generating enzyme family protein [Saprospiraceae bacterium]|nr:formylglycine-generating enzyme family protein [Saprospiraceae bacterium]